MIVSSVINMTEDHSIRDAGNDLIEYSKNFGEEETRSLTELLFPSIFTASKRMSARAISRWFEENKGIKFSAASVSKALRNQERYLEKIADRVQPIAEHVAKTLEVDVAELLTEKTPPPDVLREMQGHSAIDADHYLELESYLNRSINELRKEWFSLDGEIRVRSLSYFDFYNSNDDESNDEK